MRERILGLTIRNPVIRRYARARLRKRTLIVFGGLAALWYLIIIAAPLLERWGYGSGAIERASKATFLLVLVTQYTVMLTYGLFSVLRSLAGPARRKAAALEATAPVTPWQTATGTVLGAPVLGWAVAGMGIPIQFLCVSAGGVGLERVFAEVGLMLAACLMFLSAGAVASALAPSVAAAFLAVPPVMILFAAEMDLAWRGSSPASVVALVLAGWARSVDRPGRFAQQSLALLATALSAGAALWLAAFACGAWRRRASGGRMTVSHSKLLWLFFAGTGVYLVFLGVGGIGWRGELAQLQSIALVVAALLATPSPEQIRRRAASGGRRGPLGLFSFIFSSGSMPFCFILLLALLGFVSQLAAGALTLGPGTSLRPTRWGWPAAPFGGRLAGVGALEWLGGALCIAFVVVLVVMLLGRRRPLGGRLKAVLLTVAAAMTWLIGAHASAGERIARQFGVLWPLDAGAPVALLGLTDSWRVWMPFAIAVAAVVGGYFLERRIVRMETFAAGDPRPARPDRIPPRRREWPRRFGAEYRLHARRALTGWRAWALIGGVAGAAAVYLAVQGFTTPFAPDFYRSTSYLRHNRGLVFWLSVLQFTAVLLIGPYMAIRSVSRDAPAGRLDLLRTAPSGAWSAGLGRLAGATAPAWLFVAPALFAHAFLAYLTVWPGNYIFAIHIVLLLSMGLAASALAMLVTAVVRDEAWSMLVCTVIGGFVLVGGVEFRSYSGWHPAMLLIGGWAYGCKAATWTFGPVPHGWRHSTYFFPPRLLFACLMGTVYLVIAVACAVFAARRIQRPEGRMVSSTGAGAAILAWALAWAAVGLVIRPWVDSRYGSFRDFSWACQAMSTVLLLLFLLAMLPRREQMTAGLRPGSAVMPGPGVSARSTLRAAVALAMWVVAVDAVLLMATGAYPLRPKAFLLRSAFIVSMSASATLLGRFCVLSLRHYAWQTALGTITALSVGYVLLDADLMRTEGASFFFPRDTWMRHPRLLLVLAIVPAAFAALVHFRMRFIRWLVRKRAEIADKRQRERSAEAAA